jgi:predicted nucleic acid-binding protein
MPYLIDSDILIDHLGGVSESTDLLMRLAPDGLAISTVTYMEVLQGCLRQPNLSESRSKLDAFTASVPVIPVSVEVAERCAVLRETLRSRGRRVGARALDLLIAATALEHGLVLVTRNVHDYADIPDLRLESGA